jgi:hypothetical protein
VAKAVSQVVLNKVVVADGQGDVIVLFERQLEVAEEGGPLIVVVGGIYI